MVVVEYPGGVVDQARFGRFAQPPGALEDQVQGLRGCYLGALPLWPLLFSLLSLLLLLLLGFCAGARGGALSAFALRDSDAHTLSLTNGGRARFGGRAPGGPLRAGRVFGVGGSAPAVLLSLRTLDDRVSGIWA